MCQWRIVNGTGHYVGSRRNTLASCGALVGATFPVWSIITDVGTIPLCERCKATVHGPGRTKEAIEARAKKAMKGIP